MCLLELAAAVHGTLIINSLHLVLIAAAAAAAGGGGAAFRGCCRSNQPISGVTVYNGSPLLTTSRALQQGHAKPCALDRHVQGSCLIV
jgi:hypothetical protein